MAIYSLPKRFITKTYPASKKPSFNSVIDRENQIGKDLLFYFDGNGALAGAQSFTGSRTVSSGVIGTDFGANTDTVHPNAADEDLHRRQDLTTFVTVKLPSSLETNPTYVYQTDARWNIAVNKEGITNALGCSYYDGSQFRTALLITSIDADAVYTIIFSKSSGNAAKAWAYADGILVNSITLAGGGTILYEATRSVNVGDSTWGVGGNGQNLCVYQAGLIRRSLSDAEAKSFGESPYQIIKNQSDAVYITPSGPLTPSATPVDQSQIQTQSSITATGITPASLNAQSQIQVQSAITVSPVFSVSLVSGSQAQTQSAIAATGITPVSLASQQQAQNQTTISATAFVNVSLNGQEQIQAQSAINVTLAGQIALDVQQQAQNQSVITATGITPVSLTDQSQTQTQSTVNAAAEFSVTLTAQSQAQDQSGITVTVLDVVQLTPGTQNQIQSTITASGISSVLLTALEQAQKQGLISLISGSQLTARIRIYPALDASSNTYPALSARLQ